MNIAIPAREFVTDTMGLVLWLERRKFSPTARAIYESAEAGNVTIHIPAIVLAEILYLSEKCRISLTLETVAEYLAVSTLSRVAPRPGSGPIRRANHRRSRAARSVDCGHSSPAWTHTDHE